MRFSIITPSFNSLAWLKLCAASIADQAGVEVEHIVQDACSTDGTGGWLQTHPAIHAFVESDEGMYDAVNRGFRRAQGDILSYLNCDEQYLPQTLVRVQECFESHPHLDVVFGDVIVVDADGRFICERRVLTPKLAHTRWGGNLSFFTAATFLRRSALVRHSLYFDASYRAVGDAVWALKLLAAGVQMMVLPETLSTFTETGANLGMGSRGMEEFAAFRRAAPLWVRLMAPAALLHHRFRRWRAGHYQPRQYDYAIYTRESPAARRSFHVAASSHRWKRNAGTAPPRAEACRRAP